MQKTTSSSQTQTCLEVNNEKYHSTISKRRNYINLAREQIISKYQITTDVFAPSWMIAFAHKVEKDIYLNFLGERIKFADGMALFVPPFCPISWEIMPQTIVWEAFFGQPESHYPDEPFIFEKDDLEKFLNGERIKRKNITYFDKIPYVPLKVKNYIDNNFKNDFKINDISTELNISKYTITHYFKKTFNLPPIGYRNLLRASYAHYLLLEEKSFPNKIVEKTGFTNYSCFKKNFKTAFHSSPNKLVDRKKK